MNEINEIVEEDKITSVRVRVSTRNKIDEFRMKDETFEAVLLKLLENYSGEKYKYYIEK